MPERLVFFLKSSGPTFLKARNVSGLLLPASITVKAASASSCGTGKSSLGIHNRAGTIRRPASSQHFFTLSVQTRLFKCFCWTSADGWQKKTCVHLTCRRHLLFLPLPPPHTHRGAEEPSFLAQKNSSLAHLTVPPSSLISGNYKITWQEEPTSVPSVPQPYSDPSALLA